MEWLRDAHAMEEQAEQMLEQYANGRSNVFPARVICLRPGRLIMAKGSICPAVVRAEGDLLYFLMIDASA